MKLTNPERLILMMLAEIHEAMNIKDGVDADFVKSAIHADNTWALSVRFPGIFGDNTEGFPPHVSEVADILDMWTLIEESYEGFGPQDRKKVETDAAPFGSKVKFRGFDGNNETELLSVADFFIEHMDSYQQFKGRDLNSHGMPPIDAYRRMLAVWVPLQASLDGNPLTAAHIIRLLKAQANQ
jgi:uncharacterized protein